MKDKITDAFCGIHTSEELKARTHAALREKTFEHGRDLLKKRRFFDRLAACAAILVLTFAGLSSWFLPVSRIGLEINPSLEVTINLLGRVISLDGLNDDGRSLAVQLQYVEGLPYDDAVERILISDQMEYYVARGDLLSISVSGADISHTEEMLSRIVCRTYAVVEEGHLFYCRTDPETARAAHDAGLSVVRYQALQKLQSQNPTVTASDVDQMSITEICSLLDFVALEDPCGE